jgi:hypothetical protein
MADDADTIGVDLRLRLQHFHARLHVGNDPVVPAFFTFLFQRVGLWPPVKNKRYRDEVTVVCKTLGGRECERIVFETCVSHRNMLRHENAGMRPSALGPEDENFHWVVENGGSDDLIHLHGVNACWKFMRDYAFF